MCERLLNLQEMCISAENICIEVYGKLIGTFTLLYVSAMMIRCQKRQCVVVVVVCFLFLFCCFVVVVFLRIRHITPT